MVYILICAVMTLVLYLVFLSIGRIWVMNSHEPEFGRAGNMIIVMYLSCPLSFAIAVAISLLAILKYNSMKEKSAQRNLD